MQATQVLKHEHDTIERVLDLLEDLVDRIQRQRQIPEGFAPWAIEFFRTFADRCHHGKEEDVLFPLLEQRGIPREGGPIGVMLHEHTMGRQCVSRMEQATQQQPCDCRTFAAAAADYAQLLRQHIDKENNVLFKMAEMRLSEEDDRQLTAGFEQSEHDHGGCQLHDRFERELSAWERQFGQDMTDPADGSDENYEAVMASYYRCEDAGGLFDTFYEVFFAISPEIAAKFAHTDMEKQKQIVMASLLWVMRLYKGDPAARVEVDKLAVSHDRQHHNVRPELYELWLDALCESVARHDPQFTDKLQSQWRSVMRTGIEAMKSKF